MLSTIFKNARVASTKVQTKHNRKFALASFALASALAMGLGLAAAKAEATNYYVSPAGNNTSGNSWVNAWSELNKIQWSKIKANDSILLDKGTYFTTLTVPSTVPTGVTIYQSTAAGHAGLVDIDG